MVCASLITRVCYEAIHKHIKAHVAGKMLVLKRQGKNHTDYGEQRMNYYAGIDLGGTNIKCGIVDETGTVIKYESIPTNREKPIQQ